MRVLVTGGAGYVGSFAVRALLSAGHSVVVIDDLSQGHAEALPPGLLHEGDVADRELLARLFREQGSDAVMHFAASTSVPESVREPARYYRNNVVNTLALLETMLECDVRRIVFSSTCAVYGESQAGVLRETDPIGPESPYAFSKLAIERSIADFARAYSLGYVLLRYFNACGAAPDGAHGEHHDPEGHLIPIVIQTLLGQREVLDVYGDDYPTPDGTCIRDYVHVEDLAVAHVLALEACPAPGDDPPGRTYNVGTGHGHSVLEVIRSAERVSGETVRRRIGGRRPGDAPRLVAAPEKLAAELGWRPRHADLDAIVRTAWEWHRTHPNGYGS